MAKDKVSKEELRTDPFLSMLGNLNDFYKNNKIMLQWVTTGVLVFAVLVIFVAQYRAHRRKKEQLAFENAISMAGINEYLDNFSNGTYYPLVLYKKANLLFSSNDFKGAVETYRTIIADCAGHAVAPQALLGMGYAYMALNDYENARQSFDRLIKDYKDNPFVNDATVNLARCLVRLGDNSKAQEVIDMFLENEPNSLLAPEAKKMLPEIKRKL